MTSFPDARRGLCASLCDSFLIDFPECLLVHAERSGSGKPPGLVRKFGSHMYRMKKWRRTAPKTYSSPEKTCARGHAFSENERSCFFSRCGETSSLCRIRIGHLGPGVEHGLCKTVTALKRDLVKQFKSGAFIDRSRSERLRSGEGLH